MSQEPQAPHTDLHITTRAVALGRPAREPGAPVNEPVTFTSTYVADGPVSYARVSNPTWEALEEVLGSLEGGPALAFASGLAAVSAVVALVPVGGMVVAPRHAYNGTTGILADREQAGALTTRTVEAEDVAGIVAACDGADLLLLESPTNPMMELTDVPAVVRGLRERYGEDRPVVVCDLGLPRDVHPVTLTYRADLFAEAGVDLETPTPGHDFVTWGDFHDRCLRFHLERGKTHAVGFVADRDRGDDLHLV